MKTEMPYQEARHIADVFVAQLMPYCQRIAIAGSLRRLKPIIGDIEIVCIPKLDEPGHDLFGEIHNSSDITDFLAALHSTGKVVKGDRRYKQIELPADITADVFMVEPDQWGMAMLIRTGSADFSKWFVTHRTHGGGLPSYMHVKDLRIWIDDQPLPTPEEIDVFRAAQQSYIVPELRTQGLWRAR